MPVHHCHTVQHGTSGYSVFLFAWTPDGRPATGLDPTHGTAAFARVGSDAELIRMAPGQIGSHAAGSLTEVDAELLPGVYSFDVPDAALAVGATETVLIVRLPNTSIDPVKINLVAYDPQDAWSLGMTQLQDYKRHQVLRRALPRFTEMELELGRQKEAALADQLGETPPAWAKEHGE